jgi:hypothetical protein
MSVAFPPTALSGGLPKRGGDLFTVQRGKVLDNLTQGDFWVDSRSRCGNFLHGFMTVR